MSCSPVEFNGKTPYQEKSSSCRQPRFYCSLFSLIFPPALSSVHPRSSTWELVHILVILVQFGLRSFPLQSSRVIDDHYSYHCWLGVSVVFSFLTNLLGSTVPIFSSNKLAGEKTNQRATAVKMSVTQHLGSVLLAWRQIAQNWTTNSNPLWIQFDPLYERLL